MAAALGKRCASLAGMAPVHPLLQQAEKLPSPPGGIGAPADFETGRRFQPCWPLARRSKIVGQTAPDIRFQSLLLHDHSGAHRVEVNVVQESPKAVSRLDQNRLVAPSKEMAPQLVPRIDPAREGILQPPHPPRQIRLRRLQEKMVVVAHQRKGMNAKPASLAGFRQGAHKACPIRVIPHDRLPTIPARHHMIKRSRKLQPHRSRHSRFLQRPFDHVNNKWLTPFLFRCVPAWNSKNKGGRIQSREEEYQSKEPLPRCREKSFSSLKSHKCVRLPPPKGTGTDR